MPLAYYLSARSKCEEGEFGMAEWKTIVGSLSAISAGSRTSVWGVNGSGEIFRYSGYDANPWVSIPGSLTDI
ncbi:tectonin domain-containing protein, partial [Kitasatospora sp. GAS204B]|uniref:tectonin domain-containing protein n=1 Tax=unclassified Kitasatospora TaxID=2633591 RepID=UPI0032AEE97D